MAAPFKHHIVALDAWVKIPPLNFDADITYYPNSTPAESVSRTPEATIIVVSGTPLQRAAIEAAPHLQLVACNGVGVNHIDVKALAERGVSLCNVQAQNTDTVAEHAFALYFAVSRHIVPMHNLVMQGKVWAEEKTVHQRFPRLPRTAAEEVLVVVGYGAIGKKVETIGRALGMKTLVAERKAAENVREGRTGFEEALKVGTVFVLTVPFDEGSRDMFSTEEFAAMDDSAVIVNVGRGGVINELALAEALKQGTIRGTGIDTFEHEPATPENSPLLDSSIPNLVLSPHIAWCSSRTIKGTIATVKANLEAFAAGRPQNILIAGKDCPQP